MAIRVKYRFGIPSFIRLFPERAAPVNESIELRWENYLGCLTRCGSPGDGIRRHSVISGVHARVVALENVPPVMERSPFDEDGHVTRGR
jgi:hypothetical protein